MNWGHKLTLFIVAFIIGMLGMVYVTYQQKNEMMDENYYEKEINYQSKINASKNLNTITTADLLSFDQTNIHLNLPENLCKNFEKGSLEFVKCSDSKSDFTINLSAPISPNFQIPRPKTTHGKFIVRIFWTTLSVNYYKEQSIMFD